MIISIPGIDFTAKKNCQSLAQLAIKRGNIECVQLLAAVENVDWNDKGTGSVSPIMTALQENKLEIVKILIKCSRDDVNVKDNSGQSLVLLALENETRPNRSTRSEDYTQMTTLLNRNEHDDSI